MTKQERQKLRAIIDDLRRLRSQELWRCEKYVKSGDDRNALIATGAATAFEVAAQKIFNFLY